MLRRRRVLRLSASAPQLPDAINPIKHWVHEYKTVYGGSGYCGCGNQPFPLKLRVKSGNLLLLFGRFVLQVFGYVQKRLEVGGSSTHDEVEDIEDHLLHHETDIGLEEWGGISSLEHDEAVMLEAAIFGGIPEGSSYHVPYAPHQYMQNGFDGSGTYARPAPPPPSPSLTAQRLIREQQDDEYLASLQADREKEFKAREEAEVRLIEEQAAREAALVVERQQAEELQRKLQEEQEMERQLAAKEASAEVADFSSPTDCSFMPTHIGAETDLRFVYCATAICSMLEDWSGMDREKAKEYIISCQYLFDYIDVGRQVKPGTYRLEEKYYCKWTRGWAT
ncbi:hypothetical protein ACET3Z_018600 [Daucus carota]